MKHKILFVDDCSTKLLMQQVLLANPTDCNLIRAHDAREAVQKAAAEQPDLILMDGALSNVEACREIRKICDLQHVPILMVTAFSAPSNIGDGLTSGCNDNREASLKWRGLLETVNTYLASHSVDR
jgi:CheY-like chemotaxis protein